MHISAKTDSKAMRANTVSMNESRETHPVVDVETIVVDTDDVITAFERNRRDETERHSHVLRVSPPFEGEKQATLYVSEEQTYYPPEMDPKPYHITPEAFVVGNNYGSRHPDWESHWAYPSRSRQLGLFRKEHSTYDDVGQPRELTEEEREDFEEWWDVAVETWESEIRKQLEGTEQITITGPRIEPGTVDVRVE